MSVRIYDAELAPGVPLWPILRPWDWLMRTKAGMPLVMYNCQYRNDPSGLRGVRYDVERLHYYLPTQRPPLHEMVGVQAGDPATSESPDSNYFGHATVGKHLISGVVYDLDFA